MLQLGQLDLQLPLASAGALCENIKNERGPVEDLAAENFFQVPALGGRKFVVKNDRVHIQASAGAGEFLRLARANECASDRSIELLHPSADDVASGGRS